MNKEQSYYDKRLPDLIASLKSQVQKNMDVINREVEQDLGSDKYFNVLKGRRMAAEYSISSMKEIDKLEQELKIDKAESYFKAQLPVFIDCLKGMFDNNLKVVDIDIDEEDFDDNLKDQIGDQIEEIFGKDISKKIFKKLGSDKLSEDKFHNVLKARDTARVDNVWVLKTIDDLETILYDKEVTVEKKKSWSKVAADRN